MWPRLLERMNRFLTRIIPALLFYSTTTQAGSLPSLSHHQSVRKPCEPSTISLENIRRQEIANLDWEHIIEQHGSLVWRTVCRLIPEQADAADCFQRTFISAWELSQKQRVGHWPALLRRLATARALERCRELARNRKRHFEFPDEGVIDRRSSDPACHAEASELEERLRTALADIAPREAEVFCLACLDGMSYREIASQMELSVSHVGVLLNRARSQLRSKLESFVLNPNIDETEDSP